VADRRIWLPSTRGQRADRWRNGFGIRIGPGFWLYNVSGLDAVELRLRSDEVRRIGTDDPEGLAAALKSQ
jgi:hypothetical protein